MVVDGVRCGTVTQESVLTPEFHDGTHHMDGPTETMGSFHPETFR